MKYFLCNRQLFPQPRKRVDCLHPAPEANRPTASGAQETREPLLPGPSKRVDRCFLSTRNVDRCFLRKETDQPFYFVSYTNTHVSCCFLDLGNRIVGTGASQKLRRGDWDDHLVHDERAGAERAVEAGPVLEDRA